MQATCIGPTKLKNIAEQILVWHVLPEGTEAVPTRKPATGLSGVRVVTKLNSLYVRSLLNFPCVG